MCCNAYALRTFFLKDPQTKDVQRGTGTKMADPGQVLGLGYVDAASGKQTRQGVYNTRYLPDVSLRVERT